MRNSSAIFLLENRREKTQHDCGLPYRLFPALASDRGWMGPIMWQASRQGSVTEAQVCPTKIQEHQGMVT